MGQAADFGGGSCFPLGSVGAGEKGWVFECGSGGWVDNGEGVVGGDGVVGVLESAGVGEGKWDGVNNQPWIGREVGGCDDAVGAWAREVAGLGAG